MGCTTPCLIESVVVLALPTFGFASVPTDLLTSCFLSNHPASGAKMITSYQSLSLVKSQSHLQGMHGIWRTL